MELGKYEQNTKFMTLSRKPYSDNEYINLVTYNFETVKDYIPWHNSNK